MYMKNIIKYMSLTFCSLLILSSCESDDSLYKSYSGDSFISFKNNKSVTLTVAENTPDPISIPVYLSSVLDTDLTVEIEYIEDSAIHGEHFTFNYTTAVIPAGQSEATFILNLIDDDEFNESREFLMNIKSVSNSSFVIGMSGNQASYSQRVIITNEDFDCPTNFQYWFGDVVTEDVGYGTTPGTASANTNNDCDILVVDANLVGWTNGLTNTLHAFTLTPYFEDATSGTVTIPDTKIGEADFNFGDGNEPGEVYYTSTFGTYDEETKIIEVQYSVRVKRLSSGAMYNLTGWEGTNRIMKTE